MAATPDNTAPDDTSVRTPAPALLVPAVTVSCAQCKEVPSARKCRTCGFICEDCVLQHKRLKVYRRHVVAEMGEEPEPSAPEPTARRRRAQSMPASPYPTDSPRPFVVHPERVEDLQKRVAELDEVKKEIEETCASVETLKIDRQREISEAFQTAQNLLKVREANLKEKVANLAETKITILTQQMKKFCEAIAALNNVINVTAGQVSGVTDEELSTALQNCDRLVMEPCALADISFSISLDTINELGDVLCNNKVVVVGRIPENWQVFQPAEVHFCIEVECNEVSAVLSSKSNPGNVVRAEIHQLEDKSYRATFAPNDRGRSTLSITFSTQEATSKADVDNMFVVCDPRRFQKCIQKFSNFNNLHGIAVTAKDQLVVADRGNNRLALVDRTSGEILKTMPMSQPRGVTVTADDTVYACHPHAIEKFSASGQHVRTIGCKGSNPLEFKAPRSIKTIDNELYVCDTGNSRIQVLDLDGNYVREFPTPDCSSPRDITSSGGLLYIVGRCDICVCDMEGGIMKKLELQGSPVQHSDVYGVCTGYSGYIFITENGSNKEGVYVYKPSGEYVTAFGLSSDDMIRNTTGGIAVDDDGFVYVCSYSDSYVWVF